MKLDRNLNADGHGKYGLILNRRLAEIESSSIRLCVQAALKVLERAGVIDWGDTVDTEFFVIRLRDINSGKALEGYAKFAALGIDQQYAEEIEAMAARAGTNHPNPKVPD